MYSIEYLPIPGNQRTTNNSAIEVVKPLSPFLLLGNRPLPVLRGGTDAVRESGGTIGGETDVGGECGES
eukprot:9371562-Ditylum_brightwellii.AAC.1